MKNTLLALTGSLLLAACGTQPITPSAGHIKDEPRAAGNIPKPVQQAARLSPPKPALKAETYSVVVNNVPVQELLFALARDARVNVDVHPGIEGNITLNALNQTLPQLLTRIAKQVDMRYELDGPNLVVTVGLPFPAQLQGGLPQHVKGCHQQCQHRHPDRPPPALGAGATSGGTGNNNSTTSVTNKSNNRFWDTLVQNIKDILRETDKVLPEGSSETTTEQAGNQSTSGTGATATTRQSSSRNSAAPTNLAGSPNPASLVTDNTTVTRRTTFREAASVIANPENGLLSVRATGRQHEKIREFIDLIMSSAKRQVLIEATVVEVRLSDQYQQGINWSSLRNDSTGFNLTQGPDRHSCHRV